MKLLDYKQVAAKLGIHPLNVWKLARTDQSFPQRTNVLGPRTTRWIDSEIDAWIINHRSSEHVGNDSESEEVSQ